MNKVLLIIQREYLTRVRKKSFIIMIFVVPALILVMGGAIALIAKNSDELGEMQIVKVVDDSGLFAGKFKDQKNLKFETSKQTVEALNADLKKNENLSAREPANESGRPFKCVLPIGRRRRIHSTAFDGQRLEFAGNEHQPFVFG